MLTAYFIYRMLKMSKAQKANIASLYPSNFLTYTYAKMEAEFAIQAMVFFVIETSFIISILVGCAWSVGWERSLLAVTFLVMVAFFAAVIFSFRKKGK